LDKWDGLQRIKNINTPIFIMHGARDRVVPQRFGRELFEAAKEPKFGVFPEEGNHIDLLDYGLVRDELAKFLKEVRQDQLEVAQ
jgi:fermentation-respiration switch protein FrsA (DUF1100 family)